MTRLSRGQLRIYLGAAAGVGKTYQMLGDARLAVEEGVDLVIGYLEPHGRLAHRGARPRDRDGPAHRVRRGRSGLDRAGHRLDRRAPALDRVHGRAGAHQRDRRGTAQALRGRRIPPVARHRGVDHGQPPAPREPARPRPRAHRRRRARDVPGRAVARRGRDPPDRSQPSRAARADRTRARLPRGAHRAGPHRVLHGREPRDAPGPGAARDGRGRRGRGAARRWQLDARARAGRDRRPLDPRAAG